ncbi:hypothetical protein A3K55_01215 [Candidatus Shapirobacteria bacterium RBG_13_44_7]|uniref:Uncharacterized protein n=1 Tax=Candidatus Shapirobacteria bacterium RBG_13_44_7 TaxID=1802149 RepID=A0A1F7SIS3_9BACT|nr:MAG: hypothetical protein A3K55_01215 [Candidatus Shapirobacteria bacterium RBG_13_44_7]
MLPCCRPGFPPGGLTAGAVCFLSLLLVLLTRNASDKLKGTGVKVQDTAGLNHARRGDSVEGNKLAKLG